MGMNNIQLYNLAKTYLGKGGAIFRSYCGLGKKDPYCNAYVTYILHKGDDALLYCNGKKMTYCPTSIKWCYNNLANIPIYLAMPMDIIYFDWELNGTPNHIGFVRQRKSDVEVYTIEGNTSGGIVANKVRVGKYVQAVFRPHYQATFDTSKPLAVDGQFDYSSVAMLQLALGVKVDGILGKDTVKMLQKVAGVSQDGSWGKNTSKAVQKMVGAKVDGAWGVESTKALQKWINSKVKPQPTPQPTPKPTPSGELDVDGRGGVATVKAMQRFFGTTQDGIISGQKRDLQAKYFPSLEAVGFGNGGSACVENLQRWVGVSQDGVIGSATVKAWQKKIGVTADGCFGVNSMKVWQKYLNEHDKAVYPPVTNGTKIGNKANEYAYSGNPSYAKYPSGKPTDAYKTALAKTYPNRSSWGTAARLGASCDVFVGTCIRMAGVDLNFPRGLSEQIPYLAKSSKFVKVSVNVNTIKNGDIIVYSYGSGSHICIAYGGKTKEANHAKTYGITTNTLGERLSTKGKKWVRVYRAK